MSLFLIRNPKRAKKLSWEVVAKTVDEYLDLMKRHYASEKKDEFRDEMEFIYPDLPEKNPFEYEATYAMLSSVIGNVGTGDSALIAEYVRNYRGRIEGSDDFLKKLVDHAVAYYKDQVAPYKKKHDVPAEHLELLHQFAGYLNDDLTTEDIHAQAFAMPREKGMEPGPFFTTLYRLLCGQDRGPRLGPFVKMLGPSRVAARLKELAPTGETGTQAG